MFSNTAALLLAAGSGQRFGHPCPKAFHYLGGKPLWQHSADILRLSGIDTVVLVIDPAHRLYLPPVLPPWLVIAEGGATRQESVARNLEGLEAEMVLIHDAARPFITVSLVQEMVQALHRQPALSGLIAAVPLADTLKYALGGVISATTPRAHLWQAQTPQLFRRERLRAAHRQADAAATDDAALVEAAGGAVAVHPSGPENFKITTPKDWALAQRLCPPIGKTVSHTGQGVDVHALIPGAGMHLGGVWIAGEWALLGHSDADVVLHAVTDAVLGATSAEDIGHHFPPTEERWRGAASHHFLSHAVALAAARGYTLVQADITVLGERPKIAPHRTALQANIARLLHLRAEAVTVKATTTEKLGFLGREEGLAALALVSVEKAV